MGERKRKGGERVGGGREKKKNERAQCGIQKP